jgi:hypothetical protein
MLGRRDKRTDGATRALIALVAAVVCLGGVAYASNGLETSRPVERSGQGSQREGQQQRPPRPRFIEVPAAVAVGDSGQFRFHLVPRSQQPAAPAPAGPAAPPSRWRQFECRLDGAEWEDCSSPHILVGLDPGEHSFAVRALDRRHRSGPAVAYRWSQLQPKEFTIEPLPVSLQDLMPGDPPQQIPLRVSNPNPVPIEVTALTVVVSTGRAGCPADPNFVVEPASLSPAAPLRVEAGGSVTLPSPVAAPPTVALRELPVDQNACQGATLRLSFDGEARG